MCVCVCVCVCVCLCVRWKYGDSAGHILPLYFSDIGNVSSAQKGKCALV